MTAKKQYGYNDLAGCVSQARSRATGALVGIYHAEQSQVFDPDGGDWVTTCETHHTICNWPTLAQARYHAPFVSWCECCQGTCEHPEHQKGAD